MSQKKKSPVIATVQLLPKETLLGIKTINCTMHMEVNRKEETYEAVGFEIGIIFIKFIFIYTC